MSAFHEPQPAFIAIKDLTFVIHGHPYPHLRCLIQKAQPIRKLCRDGKLHCYSMNATLSHDQKTSCCFCDHKFACQRKLRLSMIRIDVPESLPVILDLNSPSFPNFQQLLDEVGEDHLKSTPVSLKIVDDLDDRRVIEFTP